jgi:hypothetical protein
VKQIRSSPRSRKIGTSMYSIELHMRLAEVRRWGIVTVEEIDRYQREFRTLIAKVQTNVVVCSDFRYVRIFKPDVAKRMGELFRVDKPKVTRSALLVGDNAPFKMQIDRLLAEAGNPPSRRAFSEIAEFEEWLSEILTKDEINRMHQFLKSKPRSFT